MASNKKVNKKVENWVKFEDMDDGSSQEFDDFTKHRLEEQFLHQQFNEFTKNRMAKKCDDETSRLHKLSNISPSDMKSFLSWSPKILGKY